MKDTKIALLGTGANGSCTAADLTRTGHDVTLVDQWPEHVETMREKGLTINMPEEDIEVAVNAHHLCDLASLNETFDYVFLMPKAYDTKWMAHLIEPYLAHDGIMVGIQNAMTAGDIENIVGPDRTLGCVVELSSEIFTPGVVQRNTSPAKTWFGLGALTPAMEARIGEVKDLLSHVGVVSQTDDIVAAKWMKLIVNAMCLGPLAMLGLTLAEAMRVPGMREFVLRAGSEALAVGQTRGYKIQPIFGLGEEDIKDSNRLLETLFDKLAADIGPRARDCVLQDHLKGRLSEVDLINGLVAEEAAARGGHAPVNAVVTSITKRIQAGNLTPNPDNLALALQELTA
ncbi:MAG: 2-dehydropantoate 2-reductase [Rhodospirillales bacterium]|nr:2-dehydropantoate 2-reductase [Rhodospirillales bacterium]